MEVPEATSLELVAATKDEFADRSVYRLTGKLGLWRRVPRTTATLFPDSENGHVTAVLGKSLREFTPWVALDDVLAEVGYANGQEAAAK